MVKLNITNNDTTIHTFDTVKELKKPEAGPLAYKKERITSIDALRAVTLFGILLVHTKDLFGWGGVYDISGNVGYVCAYLTEILLSKRCNTIFGILFGVSFYLILRNPNYSTQKFVWRCFLLMLYGILIKIFYTYDALMWYGLWGMILACFRNLSIKNLWISFFVVFFMNLTIANIVDLRVLLFGSDFVNNRYTDSQRFTDVISYPVWMAVHDYVKIAIRSPFATLGNFLLGYCIAKSGVIENLEKYVKIKYITFFMILYIGLTILSLITGMSFIKSIGYLFGSLCYAELFLLIYYKTFPLFRFLEPYGKLGLTNYSFQGIIGVLLSSFFIPLKLSFEFILLAMIGFYIAQVIFSIFWLDYYKYGPVEWLWRCITAKHFTSNRKVEIL